MDTTLITAVILGAIAAAILIVGLWVVIGAFWSDLPGVFAKFVLKRRERVLEQADALIESRQIEPAIRVLRKNFCLDHITSNYAAVDQAVNLNLSILSRLIALSEQAGTHLENLAIVEDLIHTRGQLLKLHIDAIKTRKKKRGGVPEWAASELSRKIEEILDTIMTNRHTLQSQINILFEAVKTSSANASVTYH